MSNAVALTDAAFDSAVKEGVVLVDFWAPWCGPCRMVAPVLDELAGEYTGKASIGKVNVDEAPRLAERFGVSSIPTLLVMNNGQEAARFVGVTSKGELTKALDAALGR